MKIGLLVNDDMSVYWKKSTLDPSGSTTMINTKRVTYDNTTFKDHFLLQSYTLGQYLRMERGVGHIILSEIIMDFAESHKAPPLKGQFTYNVCTADSAGGKGFAKLVEHTSWLVARV